MDENKTWYIEARVGRDNHRGECVRFIDDRRGTDGAYENRNAEDVFAELRADLAAKTRALAEREAECERLRAKLQETDLLRREAIAEQEKLRERCSNAEAEVAHRNDILTRIDQMLPGASDRDSYEQIFSAVRAQLTERDAEIGRLRIHADMDIKRLSARLADEGMARDRVIDEQRHEIERLTARLSELEPVAEAVWKWRAKYREFVTAQEQLAPTGYQMLARQVLDRGSRELAETPLPKKGPKP